MYAVLKTRMRQKKIKAEPIMLLAKISCVAVEPPFIVHPNYRISRFNIVQLVGREMRDKVTFQSNTRCAFLIF